MRNGDGGETPALRDEEETSGQLVGQAGFPSSRLTKSPNGWHTALLFVLYVPERSFIYVTLSCCFLISFDLKYTAMAAVQGDIEIPLAPVMDLLASKKLRSGPYKS